MWEEEGKIINVKIQMLNEIKMNGSVNEIMDYLKKYI